MTAPDERAPAADAVDGGHDHPNLAASGSPAPTKGKAARESMRLADHRDPVELLEQWRRGIRTAHVGHTRAATVFAGRARALGVGATLATAVVGTTLFSSLSASPDPRLVTFAALGSVVAVILTAMQTFLNYGDLVTGHRAAASAYGDLRRRIEQLLVFGDPAQLREPMAEIAATWTKLEQDSTDIPRPFYEYAQKWVAQREGKDWHGTY
jgi:hypothetical protein